MSEFHQMSLKASFLLGLFGGVAVISTIGFFIILPRVLNTGGGALSDNSLGKAPNTGDLLPPDTGNQAPKPQANISPVTKDDHIRGDMNAAITLVEYSDFECPFCLRHQPTLNKVLSEYKGQVRLVYRHFPLNFHPQAQKAAEASECASEQGKFWEMHDKIFEANAQGKMSVDQWKTYAKEMRLNTKKFNECLDTGKYAGKVQQQYKDGASAGVEGTPATFVNGQLISGAIPFDDPKQPDFKEIIESLL